MNIISLDLGEGKITHLILQSILRKSPIICQNEEVRRQLVRSGKLLCDKLYPGQSISIPTPITYKELDSGEFNKSLDYILQDINEYFKYKGISVKTLCI